MGWPALYHTDLMAVGSWQLAVGPPQACWSTLNVSEVVRTQET